MSIINAYGDPTIINWELDDNGEKISVPMVNEVKQVIGNKIVLEGIPDEQYRVFIEGFVEIDIKEKITETNQFKVAYRNGTGVVFFHESLDGQWITISKYFSKGQYYLPSSRIWTKVNEFGEVVETLDSAVAKIETISGVIADLDNALINANTTKTDLENSISTGNIIKTNLDTSIDNANNINDTLSDPLTGTIKKATDINTTLSNTTSSAETTNDTLSQTNAQAQTIKSELDSSISTGSTLKVDLDSNISIGTVLDGSLSTTIDKGNQLKIDLPPLVGDADTSKTNLETIINNANDKKTELDDSISTATTKKAELDTSISTAETTKINLDNSISSANTINDTLSNTTTGTIKKATDINNTLGTTINSANTSKSNLDESIVQSTTSKTNLDSSIANADAKKVELDSSISTASTTKTELDTSITNANTINDTLSNATTGTIKQATDTNTALNSSIDIARTSKTNLDTSISNSTAAKTNLDNSISTANTTKTALDGSIIEGNILKGELDDIIVGTDYEQLITDVSSLKTDKADKSYVDSELSNKVDNNRVLTDVPVDAKFTDTTYSEITEEEIDIGTSSTLRTITGRRIKYILDKIQDWISALTKADVGLGNVQDYGVATQSEAETGTSDIKYMTPLKTKQAIDKFKPKDTSELTKSDVYTKTEVDTALAGKVDNSRVLTDVPLNAKFTDTITTINGKTGAISKSDITALGIPAQDTTYGIATTSTNGLMSATDKIKLNGIEAGANKTTVNNTLTSTSTTQALSANQGKVLNDKISTLNTDIIEIKNQLQFSPVKSWADVQHIVRQGLADKLFKVGDQLVSEYDGGEIVWEVIGIDVDTPADSNFTHSMTIQTKDCLHIIQFDAPEPNNPDSDRKDYGNNRYIHSAVRQWLNSTEPVFNWQSQHQYDAKPTTSLYLYDGAGFLYRLDPELVAVLGTVNKKVAKPSVDGSGQDTFSDKVFLLSRVEVGSSTEGTTTGEFVYPFYDGIAYAGRIKQLNGSNSYWWLRSPFVSSSGSARSVHTSGAINRSDAWNAYGLSPACVIV